MYVHPLEYGPPKLSGPGIASCVLAGIAGVMAVIGFFVMAGIRMNPSVGQPTTDDWMRGFAMLGSICGGGIIGVAGVVLGIVGVSLPNRRKQVAVIGLAANAGLVALLVLIMMMG